MKFLLIAMVSNLCGFVAGLPWGVTGVAAGYLAANLLTLPIHYRLVLGLLEAPVRPLMTLFTRGAGACLALGGAWRLLQPLLDPSESLARFLTSIALVLLCYGLVSFLLFRDGWIHSFRTLHQLSKT